MWRPQNQSLTAHIHLLMQNPYSAVDDSTVKNINYSSAFFPKLHTTNYIFSKKVLLAQSTLHGITLCCSFSESMLCIYITGDSLLWLRALPQWGLKAVSHLGCEENNFQNCKPFLCVYAQREYFAFFSLPSYSRLLLTASSRHCPPAKASLPSTFTILHSSTSSVAIRS